MVLHCLSVSFVFLFLIVAVSANRGFDTSTKDDEASSPSPAVGIVHHSRAIEPTQLSPSDRLANVFSATSNVFKFQLHQSQQLVKKRILKDVFSQRIGWNRFRHSVRDHLGLVIGCGLVFRGYTNSVLLHGGSIALQAGQMAWHFVEALHFFKLFTPWSYDIFAVGVAYIAWKTDANRPIKVRQILPPVFLVLSLFQCWGLVLAEWNEHNKVQIPIPSIVVAVTLTFLCLQFGGIPLPLAASALSGALLVYDSVRAEITGNWIQMLRFAVGALRSLLHLIRKTIRPVGRAIYWLGVHKRKVSRAMTGFVPEVVRRLWRILKQRYLIMWRGIFSTVNAIRAIVRDHRMTMSLLKIVQQFRKATKPILWHWAIAVWGVAVQLKYVTNIGEVVKIIRVTIDPISFALSQTRKFFDVESKARKRIIKVFQCLVARVWKRRHRDSPFKGGRHRSWRKKLLN